jgi:hypothetical protein
MSLDILSPDIHHLVANIEADIEKKRNALERPDKDAIATALLRGHIKGLRSALDHINGDHEDDDRTT